MTLASVDTLDPPSAWSFGGGTALALVLDHRVSYDIDAFLDSVSAIRNLVPAINEVTRSICWNERTGRADFQWPGNHLKLVVADHGEIDFLATASLVENPVSGFDFEGRTVSMERPAEILAKKILYRGSRFKARDVFDLAATFAAMPEELSLIGKSPYVTGEVLDRVRMRIELARDTLAASMQQEVNPTQTGRELMSDAVDLGLLGLDRILSGGIAMTAPVGSDDPAPGS